MALTALQERVAKQLAPLLAVEEENVTTPRKEAYDAPIGKVYFAERTVRRDYDHESIFALAESLKRNGFQKPIAVRYAPASSVYDGTSYNANDINEAGQLTRLNTSGDYQIITGGRLYQAAVLAGFKKIPIDVYDINDDERLLRSLTDNVSAVPVTLDEEVETVGYLHGTREMSHAEINRSIGKSRDGQTGAIGSWSENRWRIFKAPPEVRALAQKRNDVIGHVEVLTSGFVKQNPDLYKSLLWHARNGKSVAELRQIIKGFKDDAQRKKQLLEAGISTRTPEQVQPLPDEVAPLPEPPPFPERKAGAAEEIKTDLQQTAANSPASTLSARTPPEINTVEAAPVYVDPSSDYLANFRDNLEGLHLSFDASTGEDQETIRAQIIKTLESAAHQIKTYGEQKQMHNEQN